MQRTPPSISRYLHVALGVAADGPSDTELLGRFAELRDSAAFELLVWRHADMVYRTSRGVLRDHHAAEDVTQAAFLTLARKANSIAKREAVAGWLYRVARRMAVRLAMRRGKRLRTSDKLEHLPATTAAPAEIDPRLHTELQRLPEKYRIPILLCYFEGLTHSDAAKRLDWPIGTVAGRLARARELLHRRLVRQGVAVPAAGLAGLLAAENVEALAPSFVDDTTRAAMAFAIGESTVSLISSNTHELAKGAIRAMTIAKFQTAASLAAALGVVVSVSVFVAAQKPGDAPAGGGGPPPGIATKPQAAAPASSVANSAQRRRSLNNLKQIVLAIHNYHDTYNQTPTDIVSKDGKPLLSWRVEILPYLEQTQLYNSFHRDEPWDSEHNFKLLAKMPDVFRVGIEPKDSSHTYYQRFAIALPVYGAAMGGAGGPGGAPPGGLGSAAAGAGLGGPPPMGGMGVTTFLRFPNFPGEITDGTSNTVAVIEAGRPVPWTKPADFAYDRNKPLPRMFSPFSNVHNMATYDGAARALRPDLSEKVLRLLIDPNDGQALPDWKTILARTPVETAEEKKELARLIDDNATMIKAIEKEIAEYGALLALKNKGVKETEQVTEQREVLERMLQNLRTKNRQLRDDLGLRRDTEVPK